MLVILETASGCKNRPSSWNCIHPLDLWNTIFVLMHYKCWMDMLTGCRIRKVWLMHLPSSILDPQSKTSNRENHCWHDWAAAGSIANPTTSSWNRPLPAKKCSALEFENCGQPESEVALLSRPWQVLTLIIHTDYDCRFLDVKQWKTQGTIHIWCQNFNRLIFDWTKCTWWMSV